MFKYQQQELGLPKEQQIEYQGLRKSGQMHKVRLSNNNYPWVATNAGHSPTVLMKNYNEVLENEKRTLSLLAETDFYSQKPKDIGLENGKRNPCEPDPALEGLETNVLVNTLKKRPEVLQMLLQSLLVNAN